MGKGCWPIKLPVTSSQSTETAPANRVPRHRAPTNRISAPTRQKQHNWRIAVRLTNKQTQFFCVAKICICVPWACTGCLAPSARLWRVPVVVPVSAASVGGRNGGACGGAMRGRRWRGNFGQQTAVVVGFSAVSTGRRPVIEWKNTAKREAKTQTEKFRITLVFSQRG